MVDRYYKDEPMDRLNKVLMTLASYNAGPGRIRQLRRETEDAIRRLTVSPDAGPQTPG